MTNLNRIIHGDALLELKGIPDDFVDLIYLDPPFFSNRDFEVISGERTAAFSDIWSEGIESYVEFMTKVLIECHRVLRKTGSLYLHCDWHASHYLKVDLDKIFGYKNFRNEIVWRRHNAHNDTKQGGRLYGRIHDSILFYSKSENYTWRPVYQKYPAEYIAKCYRHIEPETGRRYAFGDLSGPGGRAKGNPRYEFLGITGYWRYNKQKMTKLFKEGRVVQTRPSTVPKLKRYLDEMKGIVLQDIWDDILSVQVTRNESVSYPTQKPIRLLERIIEVSSNPGDLILDPMCGSGTTLAAAHNLGRKWVGIDSNLAACSIALSRLTNIDLRVPLQTIPKS